MLRTLQGGPPQYGKRMVEIMENQRTAGHLAALFTIVIWGTTFISTKLLPVDFEPVEILFFRFVLGFAALLLVCPKRLAGVGRKQEMTFALAGILMISLNGSELELNPLGDLLAVLAAFVWACYSILTRKISSFGIRSSRRHAGHFSMESFLWFRSLRLWLLHWF